MNNPSPADQQRLRNIYESVMKDMEYRTRGLELKGKGFEGKMTNLQKKLMSVIMEHCRSSYEWIEKNGKPVEKNGQVTLELSPENQAEGVRYMEEFQECSDRHTGGLGGFMQNVKTNQEKVYISNQQCIGQCFFNINTQEDDQIKGCVRNCMESTLSSMENIFSDIENKLEDFDRRF